MKTMMAVVIFLILLVALAIEARADGLYPPLTEAQAELYLARTLQPSDPQAFLKQYAAGLAVLGPQVVKLDYVEHAGATIHYPELLSVTSGRDVFQTWSPPYIDVSVGIPGQPPMVGWKVPMDEKRLKDLVPQARWWPPVVGILAAALVSSVADSVLPMPPVEKELTAAGAGALAGGAVWLVFR